MLLKKEIDCTGERQQQAVEPDTREDGVADKRSDVQITDPYPERPLYTQQGVVDAYKQLWRICKLSAVLRLIGVLLTFKVCRCNGPARPEFVDCLCYLTVLWDESQSQCHCSVYESGCDMSSIDLVTCGFLIGTICQIVFDLEVHFVYISNEPYCGSK
jgi:hypothetical protein